MSNQATKEKEWPTVAEQQAYWEKHDIGGNILPDRIEANEDRYWKEPDWTLRDEVGESYKEIP